MNEIFEWVKTNSRLVLFGTVAAIVLSTFIGFLLGLSKREPAPETKVQIDIADEAINAGSLKEIKGKRLLLPEPVIPILNEVKNKYSFYLDEDRSSAKGLELIPEKISDLLKHRDIGLDSDIKAFQFNNEELDIITDKTELAEP